MKDRPDRQTTDSFFLKSGQNQRTETRKKKYGQTDIGLDFLENTDKNETRTGHGQRCPPTSGVEFDGPCR